MTYDFREFAVDVQCPKCMAKPGESCTSTSYTKNAIEMEFFCLDQPHDERVQLGLGKAIREEKRLAPARHPTRTEVSGIWMDEAYQVPWQTWQTLKSERQDPALKALLDPSEDFERAQLAQLSPRQLAKTVALEQNKLDLLARGTSILSVRLDPETKEFVYERVDPDDFFSDPSNKSAK